MRVQLRRSRAPDSANVSDANVLDTILLIFSKNQRSGLTLEDWVLSILSVVAKIRHPFCEWALSLVANAASRNDKKRICSSGNAWMRIAVSAYFLASLRIRFPVSKSATVAQVTLACSKPKRQDKSGLVLVAAYWRLPISPRRLWSSSLVIGVSGFLRRSRVILIGEYRWVR